MIPCFTLSSDEANNHFPKRYDLKKTGMMSGGHAVAQLVEALRYKPEGRGIDFR
jgi:hypothetical protein